MSTSFGRAAAQYERGRPDYPVDAVRWLLPGGATCVLDVGAGTGKLTGVLAGLVPEVVAVDPDAAMLATLSRVLPGVRTAPGSGEHIPADDGSADAVTFGQAWHWVDPEAASAEVGRVLRPGGVLGLIWNIRDETVPWVAELGRIMQVSAAERLIDSGGPRVAPPLGEPAHRSWAWTRSMSVDELVAMAASRSYVITSAPDRREEILRAVEALGTARARHGAVELPYVTHGFRAVRPEAAPARIP